MKLLLIFLILLGVSCKTDKHDEVALKLLTVEKTQSIDVPSLEILNYAGLEPYLSKEDSLTYVANFWATWCAPCVKELPHFEKLNNQYKNQNVEVLLVSLDFPSQYDKKLKPFIEKHQLKSKILVLDDVDQNSWIPKVDSNWDGAIPVTLIYNKRKRQFYDRTFDYAELENELKQFIN